MIDTIFIGLSGMQSFQKGLSNISNNIANLNSPGFKRTEMQFSDLMYQYESKGNEWLIKGSGVKVGSTIANFSQGELRGSSNPLDVAIDGEGFFVSNKDGRTFYTRAGQFDLDSGGFLVSRVDGSRLQALGSDGRLLDFSINGLRNQAAKPTTTVRFSDNLSSGSQSHSVDLTVYDKDGVQRKLKVNFANNDTAVPRSWRVEIQDTATQSIVGSGEIRFNVDGSLTPGFNQFLVPLKTATGGTSLITLDFGLPGSLSATTNLSGGTSSTLRVSEQDGYPAGSMTKLTFDGEGVGSVSYSNGQSAKAAQLALAWFDQPHYQLRRIGSGTYEAIEGTTAVLGKAAKGVFGKIAGGTLELSNVELSNEFSEMIITQRGYQAASQLISAANEMMQQALEMKGRR